MTCERKPQVPGIGTKQGVKMERYALAFWSWRLLALVCLVLPVPGTAQSVSGVGFSSIEVTDPVSGGKMPGYVFYPSPNAKGVTKLGPYELDATEDAPALLGARPLVVISHGHGGSDLGHHDLATYLASHGFVVATITHPKDNFRDSSGDGQAVVLGGRPRQVSATISYLIQSRRWSPLIERDRIAVAGFSNGGYTALLLVGARPRFTSIPRHCKLHPDDSNVCVPLWKLEASAAREHHTVEQSIEGLQRGLRRWGDTSDPRVKAAFVMAPFSSVFDAAGLAHINRPVFLYYAADDHVLLPRYNALHIAPLIRTRAGLAVVPNAGHYVFLAPCSPELAKDAPDICKDPPGIDRSAVHRQIDASALAFFEKALHLGPSEPGRNDRRASFSDAKGREIGAP
jgi:predicted dienelactone hydrolase